MTSYDNPLKSMSQYGAFSKEDARTLAQFLIDTYDARAAYAEFEKMSVGEKLDFENNNIDIITEILTKTESQRRPLFRKLEKNSNKLTIGLAIVFAIIGLQRVADVLELRDRYITSLVPGQSYRPTSAQLYAFTLNMNRLYNLHWPAEAFDWSEFPDDFSDEDREKLIC